MILTMLKSKLHRGTVTEADINYNGSVAIDSGLLRMANILPHEQVEIYNITNGERFTTYAIEAPEGSGKIGVNGAAVHKASEGDLVIICTYVRMDEAEAKRFSPEVVLLDEHNKPQNLPEQNNANQKGIKGDGRAAA